MSYLSIADGVAAARPGRGEGQARPPSAFATRFRRRAARRRGLAELARMSDRSLRDIGISRAELGSIAAFDGRDPSRRRCRVD